jgi:hypothetical protein
MAGQQQQPLQNKEAYAKPTIVKVRLVPDELAVSGCKATMSHTGPTTGCVVYGHCRGAGS